MSGECIFEGAGGDIPEANPVTVSSTSECLPIRKETHAVNARVFRVGIFECTGGDMPKVNHARQVSLRPYRADTGEHFSIRTKAHALNRNSVKDSGEQGDFLKGVCIIQPHPESTSNRQQVAIWRIRKCPYKPALAETHFGPIG